MSASLSQRRPRGVECLKTVRDQHAFKRFRPSFGAAPNDLDGRLYQVGPGRFEADDVRYGQWFDGEGLLTAIDFSHGGVRASCRLVRPKDVDAPSFDCKSFRSPLHVDLAPD